MQSDRPIDTLTPPRTVGGHTARLKVPIHDSSPPAHAAELDVDVDPPSGPFEPTPSSRTGGGTMRLVVDEPTIDESVRGPAKGHARSAREPAGGARPHAQAPVVGVAGAAGAARPRLRAADDLAGDDRGHAPPRAAEKHAEESAMRQQAVAEEQMRAQQRVAARDATAEHAAKQKLAHEAAVRDAEEKLAAAKEAARLAEKARRASAASLDDDDPGTLALLLAPTSVTVGLVFFALGCCIGYVTDARLSLPGRIAAAMASAGLTAQPAPNPPVIVTQTAAPVPPPQTAAPPQTAVAVPVPPVPSASSAPSKPSVGSGGTTKPTHGGGKGGNPPPLPF